MGRLTGSLLVALCLGTLVGVLVVSDREPTTVVGRAAAPPFAAPALVEGDWAVPTTAPSSAANPTSFLVADAVGPSVELRTDPDRPLDVTTSIDNPTWEGLDVVFLVLERRDEWLHVRVSSRPNGQTAWVRASDVALRRVPNWIRIELGARRVTVLHGDAPLLSTQVAIGKRETPTPPGSYFVDGLVPLDPPHRAYGAGQVSVSAFSPTLTSFGGGVGQIALHGTQATGLLGQETSNGCVRLDNDSIRRVMDLAPTGTPVEIVA